MATTPNTPATQDDDEFDLVGLRAADTADMEVKHVDGTVMRNASGEARTITVYGPGSVKHQEAQARRSQRLVARMAKQRGGASQGMSAEEQRIENATFLADITASLNGGLKYNGGTGRAHIEGLYGDTALGFIGDQVSAFAGEWGNFSQGSPKT